MDINVLVSILNNVCFTLLAVSPTVFVFGVTLLGAAIEKSQQEEKSARENEAEKIQKEIKEVEGSIEKIKKGGDTKELSKQLNKLIKGKEITEKKIEQIKTKYERINLINTVFYPCSAFISSAFLSSEASFLNGWFGFIAFGLEIVLIGYGLYKIYLSLSLIQEISANKKEAEYFGNIKEAFKSGFAEYEQSKTEEAKLVFEDKKFPLNISPSTELKIDFFVNLKKGKKLSNTSVWFFIPDGFDLVEPPENKSWRQPSDYSLPNIRTVKISSGDLNTGTRNRGRIVIKTPPTNGKYSIRCQICADGYNGENQDLKLIVE